MIRAIVFGSDDVFFKRDGEQRDKELLTRLKRFGFEFFIINSNALSGKINSVEDLFKRYKPEEIICIRNNLDVELGVKIIPFKKGDHLYKLILENI